PALASAWNDFLATHGATTPESEVELASLLAQALSDLEAEGGAPLVARSERRFVDVRTPGRRLLIGICNASPRGGHLGRQVEETEARARELSAVPVLVRCSEYPSRPGTRIYAQLGELVRAGGRRVVVED